MKGSNRVKLGSCDLYLFPLFQNVNAVGYRTITWVSTGWSNGRSFWSSISVCSTLGISDLVDLSQLIGRLEFLIGSSSDRKFSKKIDSAKNYKCITPKRNYAYRVDINSRIVSHPGHVIRTYVTSHVKYHVIWYYQKS